MAFFDHRRALFALGQDRPGKEEPEDDKEYSVLCPKCHSPEIVFQGRDAEEATGPTGEAKFDWNCDACGYQWKDDGIEQEVSDSRNSS